MTTCAHCGAEQGATTARCWDCQRPVTAEVPTLPAGSVPAEDEIVYDLSDWEAQVRVDVAGALAARGVPWRWDPGAALIVAADDEETVELVLDEAEDEMEAQVGLQALEALEAAQGYAPDGDGGGDEDIGEDAQQAMSELFLAADRLQHEPWNEDAADDLTAATERVSAQPPPFGIEPPEWAKIAALATTVREDLEQVVADDVIAQDSRALREHLRRYV